MPDESVLAHIKSDDVSSELVDITRQSEVMFRELVDDFIHLLKENKTNT